jgi:hypothetical protein
MLAPAPPAGWPFSDVAAAVPRNGGRPARDRAG